MPKTDHPYEEISTAPGELKHVALVQEIAEQIRGGELRPGEQLPSFTELRKRWGAGHETLEKMYRELEDQGLVIRKHRRGVFVAESNASRKTGMIGFISSADLQDHPYYAGLLRGVRVRAASAGVEVVLLNEETRTRWEKVDGVLYQTTNGGLVTPPGMPRVCLIYRFADIDSAIADDYVGMTQAMGHLFELGHRRIAFLSQEMHAHALSHQRLAAYQNAFRLWGFESEGSWLRTPIDPGVRIDDGQTGRMSWEEIGYTGMQSWLAEGWRDLGCTAILAHNDEMAIGVIAALQDAGLRVPVDVSVVGFDGTEIARYHRPRLTTVKVPLEEIGGCGFDLLMQQINRPLAEEQERRLPLSLTLPTHLQIGQSTAPVPSQFLN